MPPHPTLALLPCRPKPLPELVQFTRNYPNFIQKFQRSAKKLKRLKNSCQANNTMANQLTLQNDFTISGKGLHTGLHITARFCPAPANTGYVFVRTDLEDKPSIEALADNVHHTERGTVLEKNGVQVSTIEHAMAALWAAGRSEERRVGKEC